ncbi:MAG: HD domain-containing protein [Candidatus Thiodiazotropha sp. (ex Notomyrtea botanica)]|nr:HD domain-containing protein [Candidatus Thiodiazotropha sp. (ex Notomyrtea botanica)]
MNDLLLRAIEYATQAHARIDQRRKYSNQPYDVHLKAVANLVREVADDTHMIAAAWLHDAVEDTPATVQDIEREFGSDVALLVSELTDISRPSDGNRATRKLIDRQHTAKASARAKTIKLADLIDNCRDICRHDNRFSKVFLVEMEALLTVLQEGDERLYKRAWKVWQACHDQHDKQDKNRLDLAREVAPEGHGIPFEQQRALRHFTESFKSVDIAEPLASFDADSRVEMVQEVMRSKGWIVAGLRDQGLVSGFVQLDDLDSGICRDYKRQFAKGQVLHGDASLSDVIQVLTRHECCFIALLGDLSGIILRSHIQKPIVRMWLFGMITIIEMNLISHIKEAYPEDDWQNQLSRKRLENAKKLQTERIRRGQAGDLLDCLQFSDKAQILINSDEALSQLGFATRRSAKKVIRDLESLRNNLAHSQDIIAHDWPQIARMTRRIEVLVHWGEVEE